MLKKPYPKGSLLIWTITLGVMLTSVFFFFGTRLQRTASIQRSTIAYQNQKNYLKSYAEYIKTLSMDQLGSLTTADLNEVNGNNEITGTINHAANSIEGFLDSGESRTYTDLPNEKMLIEWNLCNLEQEGDLIINNETLKNHIPNCGGGTYDENTAVTITDTQLTLTAISGPFNYRLSTESGTMLTDVNWHLNLSIPLPFKETFKIEETFIKE
ncbi:hypothetical protein COY07_03835 [Candidatus Peregrinibacteria bacterium CG_4_10_14_0_2_um_filter_43_11]|nr:MAG: hypothetical protein COY07_03835 [Candidatus Peregrinibacteria bacterium CG_4_10_14_0_2_um_filter_43_11]